MAEDPDTGAVYCYRQIYESERLVEDMAKKILWLCRCCGCEGPYSPARSFRKRT